MLVGLNSSTNLNNLNRMNSMTQPNLFTMNNRRAVNFGSCTINQLSSDKFEHSNVKSNKNNVHYISFGSNANNKEFSVAAMAPLQMNSEIEIAKFKNDLQYAKDNGVKAISVDVWWGLAEKEGEGKFDWKYYEKVFKVIKEKDLKIIPILSTHQCGGNVGDNVNIPIPKWTWDKLAEKVGFNTKYANRDAKIVKSIKTDMANDLYYKNEHGNQLNEVIPVWYDDVMMPKYRAFTQEFKNHFFNNDNPEINIRGNVEELHVSAGPAGELRYPTYGENIEGAGFPSRGWFVGYDRGGKTVFKNNMAEKYGTVDKLNKAWGTQLSSFDEILPPSNNPSSEGSAKYFVEAKDYANTQYGRDFLDFYHNSLLKHGEDTLTMTHEVFKDTDVAIGIKIPGIHWQVTNHDTPRIAEIVGGQVDYNIAKENDNGYKPFFEMIKSVKSKFKNDTVTIFTCLEMDNDKLGHTRGMGTNSAAKDLVGWVLKAAKDRGLTIKGENAIEDGLRGNAKPWNMMKYNSWEGFDGITFLRVGSLNKNDLFEGFMKWVKGDLLHKGKQALKNAA